MLDRDTPLMMSRLHTYCKTTKMPERRSRRRRNEAWFQMAQFADREGLNLSRWLQAAEQMGSTNQSFESGDLGEARPIPTTQQLRGIYEEYEMAMPLPRIMK